MNEKRLYYLDYYKVYALIMLTFFHFLDFWYTKNTNSFISSPGFVLKIIQAGTLISLFSCVTIPLIAGMSFSFQHKDFKTVFRRSMYLIGIGYLLNVCLYGLSNLYEWDILQAIGLFTMLTFLILKQRKYFLLFGIVLLLLSKTISSQFYLNNFDLGKFLNLIIVGDPNGESYYSVVHFYGLYLIGYYLGSDLKNISKNLIYIIAFSSIFVPMSHEIFNPTFDNLWSSNFFMPIISDMFLFLFLSTGFLLILIKLDKKINKNSISEYLVKVSKNMTMIYILHTILFVYISEVLSNIKDFHVKLILFVFFGIVQLLFVLGFPYIKQMIRRSDNE